MNKLYLFLYWSLETWINFQLFQKTTSVSVLGVDMPWVSCVLRRKSSWLCHHFTHITTQMAGDRTQAGIRSRQVHNANLSWEMQIEFNVWACSNIGTVMLLSAESLSLFIVIHSFILNSWMNRCTKWGTCYDILQMSKARLQHWCHCSHFPQQLR